MKKQYIVQNNHKRAGKQEKVQKKQRFMLNSYIFCVIMPAIETEPNGLKLNSCPQVQQRTWVFQ